MRQTWRVIVRSRSVGREVFSYRTEDEASTRYNDAQCDALVVGAAIEVWQGDEFQYVAESFGAAGLPRVAAA